MKLMLFLADSLINPPQFVSLSNLPSSWPSSPCSGQSQTFWPSGGEKKKKKDEIWLGIRRVMAVGCGPTRLCRGVRHRCRTSTTLKVEIILWLCDIIQPAETAQYESYVKGWPVSTQLLKGRWASSTNVLPHQTRKEAELWKPNTIPHSDVWWHHNLSYGLITQGGMSISTVQNQLGSWWLTIILPTFFWVRSMRQIAVELETVRLVSWQIAWKPILIQYSSYKCDVET